MVGNVFNEIYIILYMDPIECRKLTIMTIYTVFKNKDEIFKIILIYSNTLFNSSIPLVKKNIINSLTNMTPFREIIFSHGTI